MLHDIALVLVSPPAHSLGEEGISDKRDKRDKGDARDEGGIKRMESDRDKRWS